MTQGSPLRVDVSKINLGPCSNDRPTMRLIAFLITISIALSAVTLPVSAEELTGASRRAYEKATSEGMLSTSCNAASPDFVFWAGDTPSTIEVGGTSQPVRFEHHKVGDYIHKPYQCQTRTGRLSLTTKLTHTISNAQCGAGNDFIARFSVPIVGSYSDDFLVDGCGGTSGLLIQGDRVLLCRMNDGDEAGVGRCEEATDALGPRRLRKTS